MSRDINGISVVSSQASTPVDARTTSTVPVATVQTATPVTATRSPQFPKP